MVNIQLAELIFCVVMVHEVRCRSSGAPSSACSDMTPLHPNVPQSIPPPYSISVSKNTYKPLEKITVTLQANRGVSFKGFLIQSRREPNSDGTIGTFIVAPGTKKPCSSQASLTHLDSSLKRNLSLTWIAPSATDGNVVFVATFVQNMSTYWVKVQGPTVIPRVLPPPPPPPLPKAVTITLSTTPKTSTSTNFTTKPRTPTTTISTQLADTIIISATKLTTPTTTISTQLADTTTISTTKLTTTTIPTQLADNTTNSTTKLTTTTTTIPTQLADTTIAITKPTTPTTTTILTQLVDTTTIATTKTTAITTTKPTNLADTTTIATPKPTTTYESLATGIHLTTTPTSTKDTADQPGFDATCLDHGCGTTKGCFHDCNYGASWTFLVTWKDNGGDSVEFEMKAKIPTADNYWVSLGLSDDKKMGNDSVMDCIVHSGTVTVHSSYNFPEKSNDLLQPDTFGITSESGKVEDGVLTCSFSRVRRFDLVFSGKRKRRVASSVDNFFDLDTDWYLLFAKGHTYGATMDKVMHTVPPAVSNGMADFQTVRDISSPYTGSTQMSPTLLTGGTCKDPACGRTKGCFHDCDLGTSWTFLITWADTGGNSINFEMKAKIPGTDNYWVSVGLSKDRLMGDDSVMDCSVTNGVTTTYNSYNTKNAKWNAALTNATYGIYNKGGKVEDGIFTCSFSRLKTVSSISNSKRKRRAAVSADAFFDLNEDWYLLFAFGKTAGTATSKSIHSLIDLPKSSAVKADLQSMNDLSASKVKELLIRIHGILMIIAWMTLASIGIIVARFYKPVWPDSRLGGEKIWFQIHRFCMVFVLLSTAASFVLIFVYVNGYSVIESNEFQKSHPIIGIVVMSLTVINPIMALFRPHPDDEKRPIFNFFHWGVGTSAHILAIINIFIGISLPKADASQKVTYILWTYVAWQVFMGIVLTVYDCCQKREEENYETTEMIEMRDFSYKYSVSGNKKKVTSRVKPLLLVFHVLVILGLTVAIIVIGALESS